jgi:ribosome maturation factor RimP
MGFQPIFCLFGMDLQARIETTVNGLGYELVTLEREGRGLLRVYIDKPDGIALDDCVRVSNQLTRLLAVEEVAYERLEVSSPGLDRPLVKEPDFIRFRGERAQLKLRMPLDGRRKFVGVLEGVEDGQVVLETETGRAAFPLSDIESARLAPEMARQGLARRKS